MQITVVKTGGIAGVHEQLGPIDTAQASNGPAIEAWVESMGFFEMPAQMPDETGIVDAFSYEITVVDGDRQHSVSFVEPTDDSRRGLQQLIGLVRQSGAEWQGGLPEPDLDPEPAAGEEVKCELSAWYNREPPTPDTRLHVGGRCEVPDGKRIVLTVDNTGFVPAPNAVALRARLEDGDGSGEVSFAEDLGDIREVRIFGATTALLKVTIAA